ncbi:HAD family hydrolase [Vibrio hippocampi]|uniref:Hydrolase n=1 Tax=Vibrio hippocampi TaxID=654686 RepID=A0ABM8ZGZ2_9VIBR|nr:HAD family hydrolase [Vibrio hippocampi]CAH0524934.1 hypothetical protein VHP8226_00610 [Vibrio hippocampi]
MGNLTQQTIYLFDWGDTLMVDFPNQKGKMCDWSRIEAVADADSLLSHLSKQHPIYIATNAADSNESEIAQAFQAVGLDRFISGYFCFANLGIAKGSAEFFLSIVERLGVEASQVVMIGDTLSKDVYPALEAGLSAIWFNPSQTVTDDFTGTQIATLSELIEHSL